jgi:hypothetical protein
MNRDELRRLRTKVYCPLCGRSMHRRHLVRHYESCKLRRDVREPEDYHAGRGVFYGDMLRDGFDALDHDKW